MQQHTTTAKNRQAAAEAVVAGIDLGSKRSEICCLDAAGQPLERRTITTTPAAFDKAFAGRPPLTIAIETGGEANWVRRRLESLGHHVHVADARRIKLVWDTHSKDDRRDARFLAEITLHWPELLKAVQPRSLQTEYDRALLTFREQLVEARVKLINAVRGVLASFGEKLPAASSPAFANRVRPLVPAALGETLDPILLSIEALSAQVRRCDKRIEELCDGRYAPAVRRMRSIRGVGAQTALAFTLELDNDPARLRGSRAAGALVGLRPSRRDSGQQQPQLSITKTGNPMLRKLLVQCAHYILGAFGQDCALRRWGLSLAGRNGGRRGKRCAVVATARKLAVLLHTLWRKDEDFDPPRGLPAAA